MIGASSGIGAAMVGKLAAAGDELVACARRAEKITRRPSVDPRALDVRDPLAVNAMLQSAASEGPLDYVVTCAGVGYYAPLTGEHAREWRDILETNVVGLMNVCSALLRQDLGVQHLVQIGSLAAHRVSATPGNTLYSASKTSGLIVMGEFRRALRDRQSALRVSTVSPGFVENTDFGTRYFERAPESHLDLYAAGASLTAADVADVVAWVLALPAHVEVSDIIVRPTLQGD